MERRFRWLERPHPGCGVQFIPHVRIRDARTTHERSAAHYVCLRDFGYGFLTAQTILRRQNRPIAKEMSYWREGLPSLCGFASHNPQVKWLQCRRVVGRAEIYVKLMRSGNVKPMLVQRPGVFRSPYKSPYFRHACEMRRVKAADRTTPDDANPLHLNLL